MKQWFEFSFYLSPDAQCSLLKHFQVLLWSVFLVSFRCHVLVCFVFVSMVIDSFENTYKWLKHHLTSKQICVTGSESLFTFFFWKYLSFPSSGIWNTCYMHVICCTGSLKIEFSFCFCGVFLLYILYLCIVSKYAGVYQVAFSPLHCRGDCECLFEQGSDFQ